MRLAKRLLAQRPRRHASLAALSVMGLFMLVSGLLTTMDQLRRLDDIQSTLGHTVLGFSLESRNLLLRLNRRYPADCSERNLSRLRQEVFLSAYQAEIGVLDAQQRLLCSTVRGVLSKPTRLSPPDAIVKTPQGEEHYINFSLPVLIADWGRQATVVRQGHFNTVVSPLVLDDLFSVDEGTLRLRMVDGTFHVVHADPSIAQAMMDRLGQAHWLEQPVHGYSWEERAFVSSRPIAGTQYVSQFVVPLERFWDDYRRWIVIALPLALLAGLLVYGALVPVLRRWGLLDERIAGLIRDEHLLCLYQPIVEMRSGRPVGCEVLIRMRDDAQVLEPAQFLPAVDRSGLWWALDQAVVRKALRELCSRLPQASELKVSINFFPANVHCDRLRALIEGELARYPHRGLRVDLEVIEQADQSSLLTEVACLKQAGYRVSIDDFGTGYSNLASVKAVSPDFLKIDKSFVFEMEEATVRSSLIPEIIAIAHAVGAEVIAEGIENDAQRDCLLAFGVDYGQGFLYARPLEIEAFVHYLRAAGALPD